MAIQEVDPSLLLSGNEQQDIFMRGVLCEHLGIDSSELETWDTYPRVDVNIDTGELIPGSLRAVVICTLVDESTLWLEADEPGQVLTGQTEAHDLVIGILKNLLAGLPKVRRPVKLREAQ